MYAVKLIIIKGGVCLATMSKALFRTSIKTQTDPDTFGLYDKQLCCDFRVEIPFTFTLQQSGLVHGLAFWFDVAYHGSKYEPHNNPHTYTVCMKKMGVSQLQID